MIYCIKCGDYRFQLRTVEHVDDQIAVPEEIKNLAQGFFFSVQFYYTTKLVYLDHTLSIEDEAMQCDFHFQFHQLYAEDEYSLSGKLCASFSDSDVPEEVEKTMTKIIMDMSMSIACTKPFAEYKVTPILVQIGIVLILSMKEDRLFKSKLINMEIEKGSLPGEHCVICFEDFYSSAREIVLMPCSHIYHHSCITKYFEKALNYPTCRLQLELSDE
ncbi:hypothetical protein Dsin_029134 [Dipteronia sinensis]|uniref:RING-type E3 ubiquitin transferase n=1 Tax=Dipteronia sinensis TaxID=43782 RepID=A0AAD9ZS14_9ROSI|nr:hypothetical protein Dsin_029134 [Dipteronia sinensis]